jgi:lipoprotein-anchoring transpeptidase ErfK/SrfK
VKIVALTAAMLWMLTGAAYSAPKAAMPTAITSSAPTIYAAVSISRQKMDVLVTGDDGSQEIYNWTVSTGRKGFTTPTGSYKPTWLSKDHRSKTYDDAPMPFAVFFHDGYAVHATTDTKRLGQPASHGCVRLSKENAAAFFALVAKHGKANTEILIVR